MKKTIIAAFFLVLLNFSVFSQAPIISNKWGYMGYSGGMFVHAGYMQSRVFGVSDLQCNPVSVQIKGATLGLGGKMSIFLNPHFRVGAEGYFSSCKYGVNKNSCRIGWGGVTFDLLYPIKKWSPFLGVTVGGGSSTNLIFIEKTQNNKEAIPVVHYKIPLCIINPAVGIEFFASNRISLLFKMDYMFNVYKPSKAYPHGLRFYLGVHFYHKKQHSHYENN
jgi:hypothetical protein